MSGPKKTVREVSPWYTTVVAGMASYLDSAAIVSTGIALVLFKDALGLSAGQVGALSSVLTFGVAIGALVGGRLGDRFGRRRVFTATMVVILAALVTILLAPSFTVLAVGIAVLGLGTGADLPVSLATISEAAGSRQRGGMLSFSHLQWKLGIIMSQLLGALFGDDGVTGIRILYGHLLVITVITMVLRLTVPESARWIAVQQAAARGDEKLTAADHLRALVKAPFAVPFFALLVFYSLINLALNTNGQFGAYIFTQVAGSTVSTYSTIGLITTILGLLLTIPLIKIMNSAHRMRWFIVGTTCALVGLALPIVVGPTVVTLTILLVMLSIFSVFAGEPFMKVWTQESFPTLLRSSAQGTIIAVARVFAALLALVTPVLLTVGPRFLFLILLVMMGIGAGTAYAVFHKRTRTAFDEEDADPTISSLREEITTS